MTEKQAEKQLTKRQERILKTLEGGGSYSAAKLKDYVEATLGPVSRITLLRDIEDLASRGFVAREGRARATVYTLSPHYRTIRPLDPEEYFKTKTDKRQTHEQFDFGIFPLLKNIVTPEEQRRLEELEREYQTRIRSLSSEALKKEYERLTIELSWKSSEIEGNTYTLLETEALIKHKQEAPGHNKEEAVMILNHKAALDYIHSNVDRFKIISLREIENVHDLLTRELGVRRGLRSSVVGIVGTKYKPLDNIHQIREAMERMETTVNQEPNVFAKAILFMVLIAYIQPFEDGNKRTSRLVGNAILMAHGSCPLSYRSVDEREYKKAVIMFYEQGNISYFKKLFIEQFTFAVRNYFR